MNDLSGLTVIVRSNDINRALRELKKKVYREGIMVEYRRHQAYEKPGEKRNRKHKEHLRRVNKEKMLEQLESA